MKKVLLTILGVLLSTQFCYAALTDSLVSYYKLDESSGNASDSTANALTLTNTSVTYTTGKINNGATLSGAAGARLVSSAANFDNLTEFTYATWIKITTNRANNFVISKNDKWTRLNLSGTVEGNIATTATSPSSITTNTLSTGTWYYIVFTYSDSGDRKIHIYIDGTEATYATQLVGTGTLISDSASDFVVGNYTGSTLNFAGMEDEVGIWSRALTSTEVTTLYNSGTGIQYPFTSVSTPSTLGFFLYNKFK